MREFDFIVSGGGSAGCVLAARLSKAGREVCLAEAGPITDLVATGAGRPTSGPYRVSARVGVRAGNPAPVGPKYPGHGT